MNILYTHVHHGDWSNQELDLICEHSDLPVTSNDPSALVSSRPLGRRTDVSMNSVEPPVGKIMSCV